MNILAPLQDEMHEALTLILDKHNHDKRNSGRVATFGLLLIMAACIVGATTAGVGATDVVTVGTKVAIGSGIGFLGGTSTYLIKEGQSKRAESETKSKDLRESKSPRHI